jgi:DNA-binding NarL/FixJ family response regulator
LSATVAGGDALLSPQATQGLISRFLTIPDAEPPTGMPLPELTEREREVLVMVAFGVSNDDIAARLYLSPLTAKTHVNRAMVRRGDPQP